MGALDPHLHQIENSNQSPIRNQARSIFPGWIELEEEGVSSGQRTKKNTLVVETRCYNWWWWLAQPGGTHDGSSCRILIFFAHICPCIEKLPARKSVAHNTTITQEFEIVVIKVILQFLTKWLPNGALGRKRFVKITP
jgi:hypothetical protein